VIVLRFSALVVATLSSGLTFSTSSTGSDRIITITAGTGTVVFN
jgi:hypothetical protein